MLTQPYKSWKSLPHPFKLLIVSLFALGLFFRLTHLSDRAYWHDETYTLLRTSGYTIAEVTENIFDGRVIDRDEILKYQNISPEKSMLNTFSTLIQEEPHRAPLYYAIARLWIQTFGNSTTATRLLSALISLAIFPTLYWLCFELFQSSLTGWIAIALMSISPFHTYYAQEVREYALWTVTILVMCAALLRALRLNTRNSWRLYTAAIAASLYTIILSVPICIGQLFYVFITEGFQKTRKGITFLKAFVIGFLIYFPWLSFTFINLPQVERTSAWMFQPASFNFLTEQWLINFQFLFFKVGLARSFGWIVASALLILVIFALRSLFKTSPKNIWIFIILLIFPLFLCLAIPDILLGGVRSTNARYFVPSYLGIQLAVAHLLATQIEQSKSRLHQIQWRAIALALITIGTLSCLVQSFRTPMSEDQQMAQIINQSLAPIVISNEISQQGGGTIGDIFVLSHLVDSDTRFQLVLDPKIPKIAKQSIIFLYKPLPFLKQELLKRYQLEAVYKDKLFRLL